MAHKLLSDEFCCWTTRGKTIAIGRHEYPIGRGIQGHGRAFVRLHDDAAGHAIGGFDLADCEPRELTEKEVGLLSDRGDNPADFSGFGPLATSRDICAQLLIERDKERSRLWTLDNEYHGHNAIAIATQPDGTDLESGGDKLKVEEGLRYLLQPFVRDRLADKLLIRLGLPDDATAESVEFDLNCGEGQDWIATYHFDDPRLPATEHEDWHKMFLVGPQHRTTINLRCWIVKCCGASAAYDFRLRMEVMPGAEWINGGESKYGQPITHEQSWSCGAPYLWYREPEATNV